MVKHKKSSTPAFDRTHKRLLGVVPTTVERPRVGLTERVIRVLGNKTIQPEAFAAPEGSLFLVMAKSLGALTRQEVAYDASIGQFLPSPTDIVPGYPVFGSKILTGVHDGIRQVPPRLFMPPTSPAIESWNGPHPIDFGQGRVNVWLVDGEDAENWASDPMSPIPGPVKTLQQVAAVRPLTVVREPISYPIAA